MSALTHEDIEDVVIVRHCAMPHWHELAADLLARVPEHAQQHVDLHIELATLAWRRGDKGVAHRLIGEALVWPPAPPLTVVAGEGERRKRARRPPKLRLLQGGAA